MESIKFSVIIPAYNCEKTIAKAVDSVTQQNYDNWEIIVVNDGSTDSTVNAFCDAAGCDGRIKLVNIDNSGPANARNTGIAYATGDYIMFLDSDDTYREGVFEKVSEVIEKNSPELVIFGFEQIFTNSGNSKVYSFTDSYAENYIRFGDDFAALYESNLLNQVWNKAVKRSLIVNNSIRFPDYRYGEDRIFAADVMRYSIGISVISDVFYDYIIDGDISLISGYYDKKFDVCCEIYKKFTYLNLNCRQDGNNSDIRYMFLKTVLSCLTVLFTGKCSLSEDEKKAEVRRIVKSDFIDDILSESLGHGFAVELIRIIISSGIVGLNILLAKAVVFTQTHFSKLFIKFRG